ncbi:hypothetical protein BJ322DRAFT_1210669 [Thelephora terrestris]|uniref:F-box domain-containing protein n=1 Tax=Thelephora terrestris TaxID=56493 RepID=A0A9P6HHJ5_9AGAM|nr:hypothetical protein BJ322DRAFT_1210669 [Thelephora terrestris]
MSDPRLPPEILDYIVDFLHNKTWWLKRSCLVAKSWVPRTRKHLFNEIVIVSLNSLEAWWKVFPEPNSSPGHHTRSLFFLSVYFIFPEAAGGSILVRPFPNVVRLVISSTWELPALTISRFCELICSLPLLEDVELEADGIEKDGDDGPVFQPRASPPLTGTLLLNVSGGMEHVARGLLALSNGIHFRKFFCTWHLEEDHQWVAALVERCSHTLEYFEIYRKDHSSAASIDLSNATKLREVAFWFDFDANWITHTLKTILPEHGDLRKISIYINRSFDGSADDPVNSKMTFREEVHRQWMDLDDLLVQLWESHSVRTKLIVEGKPGWVPDSFRKGASLCTGEETHSRAQQQESHKGDTRMAEPNELNANNQSHAFPCPYPPLVRPESIPFVTDIFRLKRGPGSGLKVVSDDDLSACTNAFSRLSLGPPFPQRAFGTDLYD